MILLVSPPITMHKSDTNPPSRSTLIGLSYVAASLSKAGHKVRIIECFTDKVTVDGDFTRYGMTLGDIRKLLKFYQPDFVGISCMFTAYAHNSHEIAKLVKDTLPHCKVIMGGNHVSTFPENVMEDINVDCCYIGEGESLPKILDNLPVVYKAQRFLTLDDDYILRQNQLPNTPADDYFEQEKNPWLMRKPVARILTSRGCPNSCSFCSVKLMWGHKWVGRSSRNVVAEIEYLVKQGYQEVHFVDDNFSVDANRLYNVCTDLIRRKVKVKLAAPTGVSIRTLDIELLKLMKQAGFYRLCFGLETGSQDMQIKIKKYINLFQAKSVIRAANRLGYWTSATFIIGHPEETNRTVKETMDFAVDSELDYALFYLYSPQPKTESYQQLHREGLIDLEKYMPYDSQEWWKLATVYNNGFRTKNFTNAHLQTMLSVAYKNFFGRKALSWKTYRNLMRKVRSVEDLAYACRLARPLSQQLRAMIQKRMVSNLTITKQRKELT